MMKIYFFSEFHVRERESRTSLGPHLPWAFTSSHGNGMMPAALFPYQHRFTSLQYITPLFFSPATHQQIAVVPFSWSYAISLYNSRGEDADSCIVSVFPRMISIFIETVWVNRNNVDCLRNYRLILKNWMIVP